MVWRVVIGRLNDSHVTVTYQARRLVEVAPAYGSWSLSLAETESLPTRVISRRGAVIAEGGAAGGRVETVAVACDAYGWVGVGLL